MSTLLAFTDHASSTGTRLDAAVTSAATVPHPTGREAKLDHQLLATIENAGTDELIRFVIDVRPNSEQDLSRADALLQQNRVELIRQLQLIAQRDQNFLLGQLALLEDEQQVVTYRPFWIVNRIAAEGTAEAILQLGKHADVARIRLDASFPVSEPITNSVNMTWLAEPTMAPTAPLSWGVERVKAHYVWNALGIDGRGATVAIMDTGADWQHPDLYANYRGNLGNGNADHRYSWYDTVTLTQTEPTDLLGHGTHVAGTAVGQNGIGVAPGAKWIAVNIASSDGFIYESEVHAGFQWLMAPGGDPAMAPDVVNCSWGGNPASTSFIEDIEALDAAGIIPVFAAGNSGPLPQSIESPGSNPGTLAVGASTEIDDVAWFSSRGPSVQAEDLKPWLVAPGIEVLSAIPGGRRGYGTGTSMSAPHVSGAIALLLSANPALRFPQIKRILAESAAPILAEHPNYDSGWGILDAAAAVSPQIPTGRLSGRITHRGMPMAYIPIQLNGWSGSVLTYKSDSAGFFNIDVSQGVYGLAIDAFGYVPAEVDGILVANGQTSRHDFELSAAPTGVVQGLVTESGTGTAVETVIDVAGTAVTVTSGIDGRYSLALPEGRYQVGVHTNGYRLEQRSVDVAAGQTVTLDFTLTPAPTIMLVDSGKWYNGSAVQYYQQALAALDYNHHQWSIRDPYFGTPSADVLIDYDMVIWSSPLDSPGLVGANDIITGYLGTGGNFLISGQHIGRFDGYGFGTQWWWYQSLKAQFQGGASADQLFQGRTDTLFEGIDFTLNDGTSASNQIDVDISRPRPGSLTTALFDDQEGKSVALQASLCEPFRMVYLGFGLEGVTQAEDRNAVLNAAISQLQTPRQTAGILWDPDEVNDFAVAGSYLTYTLTVRNLSETVTDTLELDVDSSGWASQIVTSSLTLGPCQEGQTVLRLAVPDNASNEFVNLTRITATSSSQPDVSADISLTHKVPGNILLVDDDRWYNQEHIYQEALEGLNIPYDYWEIGWDQNMRGSPPSQLLNAYDMVLWFTAYDWFKPITAEENRQLQQYLDQGGRLFLTSQDFLYYHQQTPLSRKYLGIIEYQESITPTEIFASSDAGSIFQLQLPQPLDYGRFQNFSDGIVPAIATNAALWNDRGMASAVTNRSDDWRILFMAFPFEKLPQPSRQEMLMQTTGWLGDLGDSTMTTERRSLSAGDTITYTIQAVNSGSHTNQVTLSNQVPTELTVLTETISGNAQFDAAQNILEWQGELKGLQRHVISYQAVVDSELAAGSLLKNSVQFSYTNLPVRFAQTAAVWIDSPDFSGSRLSASTATEGARQLITYTLALVNSGLGPSHQLSASLHMPPALNPISSTLKSSQGTSQLQDSHLLWTGTASAGDQITISIVMSRTVALSPIFVPATAVIDDGITSPVVRYIQPRLDPYQALLPVIRKY